MLDYGGAKEQITEGVLRRTAMRVICAAAGEEQQFCGLRVSTGQRVCATADPFLASGRQASQSAAPIPTRCTQGFVSGGRHSATRLAASPSGSMRASIIV